MVLARVVGHAGAQVGGDLLALVHPDDQSGVRDALLGIARPGGASALTCRVRQPDGTWPTLELAASDLRPALGAVGIVVTARDVTAQARAERQRATLLALGGRRRGSSLTPPTSCCRGTPATSPSTTPGPTHYTRCSSWTCWTVAAPT